MTGPATIESHVVPTITAAAQAAGRPAPRFGVGLPVCVTDDPDGARAVAAKTFEVYGTLPSYRAMLDREGAAGPPDVAVVGSETEVAATLERLATSGTTDFIAAPFGSGDDIRRTDRPCASCSEWRGRWSCDRSDGPASKCRSCAWAR